MGLDLHVAGQVAESVLLDKSGVSTESSKTRTKIDLTVKTSVGAVLSERLRGDIVAIKGEHFIEFLEGVGMPSVSRLAHVVHAKEEWLTKLAETLAEVLLVELDITLKHRHETLDRVLTVEASVILDTPPFAGLGRKIGHKDVRAGSVLSVVLKELAIGHGSELVVGLGVKCSDISSCVTCGNLILYALGLDLSRLLLGCGVNVAGGRVT
mmetsp:Transcript_1251/g.3056  ORF Transcript_1251/g.3056 Transcript_1251/m.3056 type:complete len:210 (+) Transcript_1251:621-1250(+)